VHEHKREVASTGTSASVYTSNRSIITTALLLFCRLADSALRAFPPPRSDDLTNFRRAGLPDLTLEAESESLDNVRLRILSCDDVLPMFGPSPDLSCSEASSDPLLVGEIAPFVVLDDWDTAPARAFAAMSML